MTTNLPADDSVELRPAHVFTCNACGRDTYVNGIVPTMTPELEAELREDHGVEPWEHGNWMLAAERVKCGHCGAEFRVEQYGSDDDDDE